MSHEPLRDKTALVTGAAKRLGGAITLALAAEGVNVVVHYNTSAAEADEPCGELRGRGVSACTRRSFCSRATSSPGRSSTCTAANI